MQEGEGNDHNNHNRPEVDELGGEDGRVAVSENYKVVAFYIEESKDDVPPPVFDKHPTPFLEAVLVDGVGGVDEIKENVVEEGLERWYRCPLLAEEAGESV